MQSSHRGFLTATVALLIGGCASTKVTGTWKSPAVETMGMHNVLVVAYVPTESVRRNLEDRLIRELAEDGVVGVPSYRLVENTDSLDKDSIRELVRDGRFDSVLMANYIGTTHDVDYVPLTTYYDYFGYWSTPGMVDETTVVQLEFRLFDARDKGRMVWSATTSTFDPGEGAVPEVADKIIARLEDDRNR